MGGGDLNLKKSWHPSTFRNQEKVWKREQKVLEEQRKLETLLQEKRAEREREELQALHRASGKGGASGPQKLDWMYTGGPAGSSAANINEEREEYLLGRRRIDSLIEDKAPPPSGVGALTAPTLPATAAPGAAAVAPQAGGGLTMYGMLANTARDLGNKIREDPLLEIKRREQASMNAILANPLHLAKLRAAAAASSSSKCSAGEPGAPEKRKSKRSRSRDDRGHASSSSRTSVYPPPPTTRHSRHQDEDRGRGSSRRDRSRRRSPPSSYRDRDHDESSRHRRRHDSRERDQERQPDSSSRHSSRDVPRERDRERTESRHEVEDRSHRSRRGEYSADHGHRDMAHRSRDGEKDGGREERGREERRRREDEGEYRDRDRERSALREREDHRRNEPARHQDRSPVPMESHTRSPRRSGVERASSTTHPDTRTASHAVRPPNAAAHSPPTSAPRLEGVDQAPSRMERMQARLAEMQQNAQDLERARAARLALLEARERAEAQQDAEARAKRAAEAGGGEASFSRDLHRSIFQHAQASTSSMIMRNKALSRRE